MLKIERDDGEEGTVLRLIGRIRSQHVGEIKTQLTLSKGAALDLAEVTMVDIDAVRFLSSCEEEGSRLLHCSLFVREWIERERSFGGK